VGFTQWVKNLQNEVNLAEEIPLATPVGTNDLVVCCRNMTVILTVEDEPLVSQFLGWVLEDAGYEVVATANADDAIEVLESRSDIRLVITDINMPGSMDGLKLAAAVKGRWPPIKIIVSTGMGKPKDEDMPPHSQFLSKPHVPDRVLAAVRHSGL
jgi:CheY-like chemotaxis protein